MPLFLEMRTIGVELAAASEVLTLVPLPLLNSPGIVSFHVAPVSHWGVSICAKVKSQHWDGGWLQSCQTEWFLLIIFRYLILIF